MLFNRSVYIYLTIFMLILIGSAGNAVSGTPDTIETIASLSPTVPTGVATDSSGNIYIADTGGNRIIMATAAGAATLTVGTGTAGFTPTTGYSGLNTTLADTTIQLNAPSGVAVDANGNVYIADTGNHRIHMIVADTTTKLITAASRIITIAGSGIAGFSGDGSLSNVASLNSPTGVAIDASGNVFIADNGNYRIRKALAVKIATTGVVTYGTISTIAGDGKATTLTAYGIAIAPAPAGDMYIADSGNNRIVKLVAKSGALVAPVTSVTIAGSGTAGFFGDGGLATLAQFNQPSGVATDGKDLYVADTMNNCIRKVSLTTGVISTRTGSAAQNAAVVPVAPVPSLSYPMGIGINSAGTVYIADSGNDLIDQVFASVSAITTASPPGGTYSTSQSVTLTASKAANISYKINGGAATPYTGPITISGPATTVLTYTSLDVANHQEATNIATYVFDTAAPTTSATINATAVNGVYYSAQSALTVTLSSNTPSATIYYTTSGTAPTAVVTNKYTSPFTIPVTSALTTVNVQFFAVDAVGNKEVLQSQKYTIVAINSTASPAGGSYRSAQVVTLASNDSSAAIFYTTDGSDPTTASTQYNSALHINIAASTTLKFRARDANLNLEQTKTQIYTIDSVAPTTTASPTGASFATPQTVTLTPDDLNSTIYYTTTGIAPTTTSTKYTGPITISKTTTLMFFAIDPAGNSEVKRTEIYTIDAVAPVTTASIQGGTYASIQSVALTSDDPAAIIYYTTDGLTPTTLSTRYSVPIFISSSTKLQYFAVDAAGNKESIKEQDYNIVTLTTTASPKGGIFTTLQTVALAANGVGTKIYYTVDGTTPTEASSLYETPILMANATTTLQFFAVDEKGVMENVKTEVYAVDSMAPTTTITCGTTANTITLTSTDGVDLMPKIRYIANTITNGGATAAYTLADYTTKITFTNNTIVKFFATDAAGNTEQIKTGYCQDVIAPLDVNPSLYLETLPNAATTSNSTLFIRGNVAPFATATVDVNGTVVTIDTADGSFAHPFTLLAGANIITTTATNGVLNTVDIRTINSAAGTTPTSIAIGASNGVINHAVRVPISFTSGYQASALSIDIAYDPTTSRLSNPVVEIAKAAAALGKSISGGIPAAGIYRILIMDNPQSASAMLPLPDGEIAYLTFSILLSATAGAEPLSVSAYSATDLNAADMTVMPVLPAMDGKVNVVSKPGNNIGSTTGDADVTLKGVQDTLYMLLDPVTHPVDGSADLNADGIVQIYELQKVINAFVGL